MLTFIRLLISYLNTYFLGRIIYCFFCHSKGKQNIVSKFHSFYLGLGFTSIYFWFYTVLTNGNNTYYPILEYFTIILLYFGIKQKKIKPFGQIANIFKTKEKQSLVIDFLAKAIIILIILLCSIRCLHYPEGTWDAIAMWNIKAKFLSCGNEFWTGMFTDCFYYAHRDYPLFLSCIIARSFLYIETVNPIVPMIFSGFFCLSCFILPYLYLKTLKNQFCALFAICLLSFSPNLFHNGCTQFADIPLAVYFLVSLYELIVWDLKTKHQSPCLCIAFSSLCFWIKNEGIPWFITYSLILFYYLYIKQNEYKHNNTSSCKRERCIFNFVSKPILLFIPSFTASLSLKYLANINNDMLNGIFNRINLVWLCERHLYIISYCWEFLKKHICIVIIPIFIILNLIDIKFKRFTILFLLIGIMYLCYYFMYLLTPYDIQWHLETSFSRIATDFLPSLIFLGCLLFSSQSDK